VSAGAEGFNSGVEGLTLKGSCKQVGLSVMKISELFVFWCRLSVVSAELLTGNFVMYADSFSAMWLSYVGFISAMIVASLKRQHPLPPGVVVTQCQFLQRRANMFHRLLSVINLWGFENVGLPE
jgi:hypothetical protein